MSVPPELPVETNQQGEPAQAANSIFCTACGNENPRTRGACLICYSYLCEEGHGLACPACGHDNDEEALFCQACGNPFSAGARRVPGLVETALSVLQGGVASLTEGEEHEEYEEGFYEEEEAVDELAPESAPPEPAPVVAAEPVAEYEDEDDDTMGMPPRALDLQDEPVPAAPVAAAAAIEDEVDEFAPPPPLPGMIEDDVIAPPAPPPVMMDDEDDDGVVQAPAPPPVDFGLDEVMPDTDIPAAAALPEPPAVPAVVEEPAPVADEAGETAPAEATVEAGEVAPGLVDPLAQASAETADEDFGDWSLDFNGDDSSSS